MSPPRSNLPLQGPQTVGNREVLIGGIHPAEVEKKPLIGYFLYPHIYGDHTKEKEEIVQKVSAIASTAQTIVFANFKGLNVAAQNEMRKALRAQNIGYFYHRRKHSYTHSMRQSLRRPCVAQWRGSLLPMAKIKLAWAANSASSKSSRNTLRSENILAKPIEQREYQDLSPAIQHGDSMRNFVQLLTPLPTVSR